MAPVQTQKRALNTEVKSKWSRLGVASGDRTFVLRGDQETTSFRTSGPMEVNEDALSTRVTYNPFTGAGQTRVESGDFRDTGHEFFTRKRVTRLSHPSFYTKGLYGDWYRGPLYLENLGAAMAYPTVDKMSQNDIKFYGAKAIAATTPTQPSANVAQLIGELVSDGLPITGPAVMRLYQRFDNISKLTPKKSVLGDKASAGQYLSSIGDVSLALQFGVEPLVRDMVSILLAVSSAAQRIEQWYRDSGRQVRRSMAFPQQKTTTVSTLSGGATLIYLTSGSDGPFVVKTGFAGPVTLESTVITDTWFSGAYMYYASVGETVLEKIMQFGREADLILGLKPTYETLWELFPWSWLIDWKANVGDAISNMTRFSADKLVLRYGYLMRKTSATNTYTADGLTFYDQSPGPISRQLSVVQKERYRSTPYGFALNPADFTAAQWQILASLGLSKGGRFLP